MKINASESVHDLQVRFQKKYPLLKLEVYAVQHEHFETSAEKDRIRESTPLKELNPDIQSGDIRVKDEMTVNQFESILEHVYGLHAQVFRKSGDTWLQTSRTDGWTLAKQMEKAEH